MSDDEDASLSASEDDSDVGGLKRDGKDDSSYGGSSSAPGTGTTETETEEADGGSAPFAFPFNLPCPLLVAPYSTTCPQTAFRTEL
jgi:hypothetical protein